MPTLETLESLLDKSLVRRRTGMLGEDRFWMLETIREFAGEQLAEDERGRYASRRRHAERMFDDRGVGPSLAGHGLGSGPQRHELVLAERDDMRAALDWASDA